MFADDEQNFKSTTQMTEILIYQLCAILLHCYCNTCGFTLLPRQNNQSKASGWKLWQTFSTNLQHTKKLLDYQELTEKFVMRTPSHRALKFFSSNVNQKANSMKLLNYNLKTSPKHRLLVKWANSSYHPTVSILDEVVHFGFPLFVVWVKH